MIVTLTRMIEAKRASLPPAVFDRACRVGAADLLRAMERRPGQIITRKKVALLAALIAAGDEDAIAAAYGGGDGTGAWMGEPSPELEASYWAWVQDTSYGAEP